MRRKKNLTQSSIRWWRWQQSNISCGGTGRRSTCRGRRVSRGARATTTMNGGRSRRRPWCRYSGQERPIEGQWIAGAWELPYQREADAVQQAAELADRFRRAYHASIRALRDWRRYPVIVQNAGQVNIAADGGQQVNVQAERKRKKTPKGTMAARKLKP